MVVVVVRTRCYNGVFLHATARLHLIGVAEHLGVRLPASPPPWASTSRWTEGGGGGGGGGGTGGGEGGEEGGEGRRGGGRGAEFAHHGFPFFGSPVGQILVAKVGLVKVRRGQK